MNVENSTRYQFPHALFILTALRTLMPSPHSDLGLFFLEKDAMCAMHKKHFGTASLTDCMSFPISDEYLGDIVVCPDVAIAYAKKHSICCGLELTRYIVHGYLHLLGYEDEEEKTHAIMWQKQEELVLILVKMGVVLGDFSRKG